MKNKALGIIFYVIAGLLLGIYIGINFININLTIDGRLIILCSSCLFLYLGSKYLSKYRNVSKTMKINLWIYFILYLSLLIRLTLFDSNFGRDNFNIFNYTLDGLTNYINTSVNLIPFKTIIEYIKDIFSSLLDTSNIFINLLGNLVCLMPFALFLPLLFKKVDNTKKFLITILCITFGIEIIQFITFTGSCDIDDIILNTLGAYLMYKILNIKDIKNLIRNIFLLENNDINKKNVFKVLIGFIIIIIGCFILYKIGNNYYNDNLDEWMSKRNYKLEIIDETDTCDEALELFYENELYEYYFTCIKSDNVYAIINDTDKYLVKDLLNNNPTEYVISIESLKREGLEFIEKEKYKKIEINYVGNVYIGNATISDKSILDIGWGKSEQGIYELMQEVFIIPKKEGITTLSFEIYESTTSKLVSTLKYEVNINNKMEVSYKEIN